MKNYFATGCKKNISIVDDNDTKMTVSEIVKIIVVTIKQSQLVQ